MLHWWPLRSDRPAVANARCTALRVEELESREVPAVLIQVDYSFDNGFFANNPAARAVMEQVASEVGNSISGNLAALVPGGANTWSASFFNPATGAMVTVPNMTLGAGTLKVFVGARAMGGGEAGFAGTSGYGAAGSPDWVNTVAARDWGGSVTFDTTRNWFFGQTTSGLTTAQIDFYSVALHEMGHVLGMGTSIEWNSLSSGGYFRGANAMSAYGGPVPLAPDGMHWATGLTAGGQAVSLDPDLAYGQRVGWSSLDAAALRDLGWGGPGATSAGGVAAAPPVVAQPLVVSSGGLVSLVTPTAGGLAPTGAQFVPFPGFTGEVRVATGDFNGDGVTDFAFATGPGAQAVVEIINGRDGSFLVGPTAIFPGYSGGLSIAAGDIDHDGRAELILAVSSGAPPIVQTYRVAGGLQLESQFIAFDAPWFSGGLRVAAGDIDNDGYADVVVTTTSMVGAVAIYSGKDLRLGNAVYLFDPFIPLPGSTLGLNAAVGDMDGDGFADLALTFESGGPAYVAIWSGATMCQYPDTPLSQLAPTAMFLALPLTDTSGARLAMRDLDGDGRADLVVASGNAINPAIYVFGYTMPPLGGMYATSPSGTPGVNVG